MTLKSTILYGKIVQQLGLAPEEDCRRVNQLQDSLIQQGRWSPIGQLYVDNNLIAAPKDAEVQHHHRVTNRAENDKLLSDYLVQQGLIAQEESQKVLQRALEQAASGVVVEGEEWPRSAFADLSWPDEEKRAEVQDILETVFDPLVRMSGYCLGLVEDRGDLTQGRLAFQLNYISRAQLFSALHNQASLEMYKPLRKLLLELGLTNEAEDEAIKEMIDRFLPA